MSLNENLPGDGDGLIAVSAVLRLRLALGEVAGEAAGLASAEASAFLRPRLDFGAPEGDSSGAGDVAVSPAAAVVSAFLRPRCFAGDSPGLGD